MFRWSIYLRFLPVHGEDSFLPCVCKWKPTRTFLLHHRCLHRFFFRRFYNYLIISDYTVRTLDFGSTFSKIQVNSQERVIGDDPRVLFPTIPRPLTSPGEMVTSSNVLHYWRRPPSEVLSKRRDWEESTILFRHSMSRRLGEPDIVSV